MCCYVVRRVTWAGYVSVMWCDVVTWAGCVCYYVVRRELVMCVLLSGATWVGYVCVVMWCDMS